ncbi:MAG TPA: dual specificity protein phosphatase [Ktedonobacterales bacterium]|nr:dual specificity protein phosphatase [Ktedonobacterales bacterium]
MPTNADDPLKHTSSAVVPESKPVDEVDSALRSEAQMPAEPAEPPLLSGKSMLRKGFVRWLLTGAIRVTYRQWTRIAVHLFPEDSRRAAFATQIGIPLPDRLNMSWITPHLAVGGRVLPADIPRLARTGITRVVDTRSEKQDDAEALAREGIELLYLPTPDTFPLSVEQLREGSRWINEQIAHHERVLVHCEHGVGRSVLLTAAALVAGGMNAHRAIDLVQAKRWQAAPNHRQIVRLQEFERMMHQQPAYEK